MEDAGAPVLKALPEAFEGERVLLRAIRAGDGQALYEAVTESLEALRPWMPWAHEPQSPDRSEELARRWQANWLMREDFGLGLFDGRSGRLLGCLGLHPMNWSVPSLEMGYWLRSSEQGKEYMREAGRLASRFAFQDLGALRLHLTCDARNTRSANTARSIGFAEEGRLRNHGRCPAGTLRDTLVFGLTPDDFAALSRSAG